MNEPLGMDERQMSALETELREQRASSASAPSETACQPRSLALATCSLPVLDAEGLAKLWEGEAYALRSNSTRPGYNNHATIGRVYAKADQLEMCAKELRLLMAHTKSRQPEENASDDPRPLGAVGSGALLDSEPKTPEQ